MAKFVYTRVCTYNSVSSWVTTEHEKKGNKFCIYIELHSYKSDFSAKKSRKALIDKAWPRKTDQRVAFKLILVNSLSELHQMEVFMVVYIDDNDRNEEEDLVEDTSLLLPMLDNFGNDYS